MKFGQKPLYKIGQRLLTPRKRQALMVLTYKKRGQWGFSLSMKGGKIKGLKLGEVQVTSKNFSSFRRKGQVSLWNEEGTGENAAMGAGYEKSTHESLEGKWKGEIECDSREERVVV